MNNRMFDRLKWGNLVALPAISVFYVALAVIWGFPEVDKVVGSIAALEVLSGTLLGISSAKYKANQPEAEPVAKLGVINMTDSEDGTSFLLKLETDPTELEHGQKVLFSVNRPGV